MLRSCWGVITLSILTIYPAKGENIVDIVIEREVKLLIEKCDVNCKIQRKYSVIILPCDEEFCGNSFYLVYIIILINLYYK